jgi:hypothetical protein
VIPEEVYDLGRPLSKVPTKEKIQGTVRMTKAEALKLRYSQIGGFHNL